MSVTICPVKGAVNGVRFARFFVRVESLDARPVIWPIPHPYWHTGSNDEGCTVCAYVESEEQLLAQWPEAENIDWQDDEPAQIYQFTERFYMPDWFKEQYGAEKAE